MFVFLSVLHVFLYQCVHFCNRFVIFSQIFDIFFTGLHDSSYDNTSEESSFDVDEKNSSKSNFQIEEAENAIVHQSIGINDLQISSGSNEDKALRNLGDLDTNVDDSTEVDKLLEHHQNQKFFGENGDSGVESLLGVEFDHRLHNFS